MKTASETIRKYILIVATLLLMGVIAGTSAQFFHKSEVPVSGGTGEVKAEFSSVQLTGSRIFLNKGDFYKYNFNISNTGSAPFKYSLNLSLTGGQLAEATLLYLDGKFLGTLGQHIGTGNTVEIPVPYPLYAGESASHEIKLEYHIGANSYYALTESDFTLAVNAAAKQLIASADKYLFAGTLYELEQIIKNYDYEGYTVRLTGNITLSDDLAVTRPLTLDLDAYTLNLGGRTLYFNYAKAVPSEIVASRGGEIRGGTVSAYLPASYLLDRTDSGLLAVESASEQAVRAAYASYLEEVLKGGIGVEDNLKGPFEAYLSHLGVTVVTDEEIISPSTLNITAPYYSKTIGLNFIFPTELPLENEVKVRGGDPEAAADSIIASNFYFLSENCISGTEISGDIFLTTLARGSESPVRWISSNREILTEEGRFTPPYADTAFELSAIISVNGINILRTFPMVAISKTPEEKMREISILHDILVFTKIGDMKELFSAEDFSYMGLTSLTYDIPAAAKDSFDYDDEERTLTLSESYDEDSTYLIVTGVFGGVEISANVSIRINIISNISFHDAAFRNVMTYVSAVPENTLNGFVLPDNYKTDTTMVYIIQPGEVGPYINRDDVTEFVKVRPDGKGLDIIVEKLPREDTIVTVRVDITYGEITELRYFRFSVSGVIHYADDDIADINLYQELRRKYDINNDWIITAHEAANPAGEDAGVFSASNHNISSLKGIEYFTTLTEVDLSNNTIIDLAPLSALTGLEKITLSNNYILDIEPLKALNGLNYLDLSYNFITDINALKNKDTIDTLILNNNNFLGDLTALAYMPGLRTVNIASTLATTSELVKNINVIVTANQNAVDAGNGNISFTGQGITISSYDTTNRIANSITPIYEFHNVIYLPPTINYKNTNYNVVWDVSHPDIVKFDGTRAYVVRPIAGVDVKLSAQVTNGNYVVTRYFDVLSVGDGSIPSTIYNGVQTVNSADAIPDERLRYYLISIFDANNDKNLSSAEMAAARGDIDLSGKGIKDLTGLRYFKNVISVLDLRDNEFSSVSELANMTELTSLRINGQADNLDTLTTLKKLGLLQVFGVKDINSDESLSTLYKIYLNNPGLTVYKDSLNGEWDPYLEPMSLALKNLEGIYLLFAGPTNRITLPAEAQAVMYNGDKMSFSVSYAHGGGAYTLEEGGILYLAYNNIPARDEYGILNATLSIGSSSVSRELTVISVYDSEMYVELPGGGYELLHSAVPNLAARRVFLSRISSTSGPSSTTYQGKTIKYIARSRYIAMTSITFTGEGIYGVKGLELLKGSTTITQITLNGYMSRSADAEGSISDTIFDKAGYLSLSILNNVDYPALVRVNINNSVVDLFELIGLNLLNRLEVTYSTKVVMDRKLPGQERESVFTYFPEIYRLLLTYSQVKDFWAVKDLQKATYIRLHGNPLANLTLTDYYLSEAYENVFGQTIDYRIVDSSTPWVPKATDISDLGVTFVSNGAVVTPFPQAVTYLTFSGSTVAVNFPTKYKSAVDNIEWVTTVGASTYNKSGTQYSFKVPTTVTTITRITGKLYIPGSSPREYISGAAVEYVFASVRAKGSGAFTGGGNSVLDINYAFMDNDRFVDAQFALYILSLIPEYSTNGTYRQTSVTGLTQIDYNAPNGSSVREIFHNIKGIRYFTGLQTINLGYHMIADIGELYYLTALVNLRMHYNRIQSLWTTVSGQQRSVFYQMPNLAVVELYNNPSVNDYRPIAYGTTAQARTTAHLRSLTTINVYQTSTTYYPAVLRPGDPEYIMAMANTWWAAQLTNAAVTLTLIEGQTMSGYNTVKAFFDTVSALQTVTVPSEVSVGTGLAAKVTRSGVDYPLTWDRFGSNNAITFTAAGTVESISTELAATNHEVPVKVSTPIPGTNWQAARLIYLPIYVQGNREDANLKVEITAQERNTAYSAYSAQAVAHGSNYLLPANLVIPDPILRNFLFSNYDTSPKDGILNITTSVNYERNRNGTLNVSARGITDFRGLELFARVTEWNLDNNYVNVFPEMYLPANSALNILRFRYSYDLIDLSNIFFDGDGSGTQYVSIASKISRLDIRDSHSFSDEQYALIATIPNLTYLNIYANRVANLDVLHPLYKTINYFNVENNTAYANNNRTQYKRIVLDSQNGLTLSNFKYDNTILKDIIRPEAYPADGQPRELPSSFTLTGYDKTYGIKWTEVEGQNYTISYSGGKYYLSVNPAAEQLVPIVAQATYVEGGITYFTWSETLDIITLKEGDLSDLYHRTEGTIEIDGVTHNMQDLIPDPILRYYIFKNLDADTNGHISDAERTTAAAVSFNEDTVRVNSLEGIQYISGTAQLTLRHIYTDDFSPLAGMDNVTELNLNYLGILLRDTSPLSKMANLNLINFFNLGPGAENYNFLMENEKITVVNNIANLTAGTKQSLFARNAYAYARMFNRLSDIGTQMGNADFINTQDEKYASAILNAIDIDLKEGSMTEIENENNEVVLPDTVTYQGKTYEITWVRMSDKLTISDNVLTVGNSSLEKTLNLVARINYYNGDIETDKTLSDYAYGTYERLFQVRYQGE